MKMRPVSSVLAVVVVVLAPLAVHGAFQLPLPTAGPRECLFNNGLAYAPFRDGQGPGQGIAPDLAQVEEDLVFLSQITRRIRSYSTEGPFASLPQIAARLEIRVAQGVHLSSDVARNEEQIAAALGLAREGLVDSILVGNEVLTGSLLSKPELIAYIRRVRRDAPATVLVSTAETWDKWSLNLDLAGEVDFVVAHFYPFWENHPIEGAAANVVQRYRALKSALDAEFPLRDLRIVVGETGWPSAGNPRVPGVVPSPENQRRFAQEFMSQACAASIPFYYFGAFDEEWKWREGATGVVEPEGLPRDRTLSGRFIGSSWGFFLSNGMLKDHFADWFDQPPAGTRWDRDIFVNGRLATYYDIGVDSSHQRRDWLSPANDSLQMSYPGGQDWGAVFVTVGPPVDPPRPWRDFSQFTLLSLELRGENGGETVDVGIKDYAAPDDGSERKITLRLDREFRRYDVPLSQFGSSRVVVPDDLRQLYVVVEFVFGGREPQKIYARSIRYRRSA